MSLLKLPTALSGVLIVTAAGTLSLRAQTLAVPDDPSTVTAAIAVSTTEPKKVEAGNKSQVPAESAGSDERSEIKRGVVNPNIAVAPTSSTDDVRAEPSVTVASRAPQAASTDEWQFQLTPYL
ncbi:MAG: hypothetical protein ND866_07685 [Pyrinomonadaceae bacterium]|nr:hypothetical protein [Pyrinomonadaceae bacterium]